MSCSYYRLIPPLTGAKLSELAECDVLMMYVDGDFAGVLRLPKGTGRAFLRGLCVEGPPVAYTYAGGPNHVIAELPNDLPDEMTLVSEYGDLTTLGVLRAKNRI